MGVMLNVIPTDPKQTTVLQTAVVSNVSSKTARTSDKSTKGFASALSVATSKNASTTDGKDKPDDNGQLMATMAGMASMTTTVPVMTNNFTAGQQDNADHLGGRITGVQMNFSELMANVTSQAVGTASQSNTAALLGNIASQTQVTDQGNTEQSLASTNMAQIVPNTALQATMTDVLSQVNSVNGDASQTATMAEVLPTGVTQVNTAGKVQNGMNQSNVATVVPNGVAQAAENLSSVQSIVTSSAEQTAMAKNVPSGSAQTKVPQSLVSNTTDSNVVAGMSINQLQSTTVDSGISQVSNDQVGDLIKIQNQLSDAQSLQQVQVADLSKKTGTVLTDNPEVVNTVSVTPVVGNSNIGSKNSSKQVDSKKSGIAQTNTELMASTPENDVIDAKSVVTPQSVTHVTASLTGENKESSSLVSTAKEELITDTIVPTHTVKNSDDFASLLTQQTSQVGHSSEVSEGKQVSTQPVSDPYNITSQIVDQARLVTKSQNTEMIIQLKPEHLGELTFKVAVENGVVSASFHSNDAEVRSIIESSLTQLKQDLSNQGLKIDSVGVYAGLGQFFSNGQQSGSNQQPELKVPNKKETDDFMDALQGNDVTNTVSDGSGVDYRV